MKRQYVEKKYFDLEKAEKWEAGSFSNGHNLIDRITGSQWMDSYLFRSKNGNYFHHISSRIQGTSDSWEIFTKEKAAHWFLEAEIEDIPSDLSEILQNLEA